MDLGRFVPDCFRSGDDAYRQASGPGALLFADISGFTQLTEHYSRDGRAGMEVLRHGLDSYFDRLIEQVTGRGGDIIGFAGDGLLATWRGSVDDDGAAVAAAAGCARDLQLDLADFEVLGGSLSTRVAVCSDRLEFIEVGGADGRAFALLGGPVLEQMKPTVAAAEPGQAVLSDQAWSRLAGRARGRQLPGGQWLLTQAPSSDRRVVQPPVADPAVRRFVPEAVQAFLEAGEERWLGELRTISSVFVQLPPPSWNAAGSVDELSDLVLRLQRTVYAYGGEVNKVLADDKGVTLIAAWGTQESAHEDDAERALLGAQEVHAVLARAGHRASIGVARGTLYCGMIGNDRRAEFTLLGRTMNLSARLMEAAEGRVLCDEATRDAVRSVPFDLAPPIRAKGFEGEVPVFVPKAGRHRPAPSSGDLFGRDGEHRQLSDLLLAQATSRRGNLAVVEGEAGVGKSVLLASVEAGATKLGVRTVRAEGRAVERTGAYHAFRVLLADLLELPYPADRDELRAGVLEALSGDPWLVERAALLNDLLSLGIPETPFTESLADDARQDNTCELLSRLMARAADAEPLVVFVDDAHWLDSASLGLLRVLASSLDHVLFVIGTRPLPAPHPPEWTQLVQREGAVLLPLNALNSGAVDALISRHLGVDALPPALSAFVARKGEGNPFFSEELALALRDAGHIVVQGRDCLVSTADGRIDGGLVPSTVQGLVSSRLDRLPPRQQLVAKAASVVGRTFALELLRAVMPLQLEEGELLEALAELSRLELVRPVDGAEGIYEFRHALAGDALYDRLLLEQRRELHRSVVRWYEALPPEQLANDTALLAHHAVRAEDWPVALLWLERAGLQALERGACRETIGHLQLALELVERHGLVVEDGDEVAWRCALAEAHFRLGDMDGLIEHGRQATAELGLPLPTTQLAALGRVFSLAMRRLLFGGTAADVRAVRDDGDRVDRLLALLGWLVDAFGYKIDLLPGLVCLQLQLQLAELRDRRGPLAESLLMAYFWTAPLPLTGRSSKWFERSLALAEDLEVPSSKAFVLGRAGIAHLYAANWAAGEASSDAGAELARACGNKRILSEALGARMNLAMHQGQLDEAVQVAGELRTTTRLTGDAQQNCWAEAIDAEVSVYRGDLDRAHGALARVGPWLDSDGEAEAASWIWAQGVHALLALRSGNRDDARQRALRTMDRFKQVAFPVYWMQGGIACAGLALHELLVSEPGPGPADREVVAAANAAAKGMRKLARFFPFARPAALWLSALKQLRDGRTSRAERTLLRAATTAEESGVRWVALQAREALSLLPTNSAVDHARLADALAVQIGVPRTATADVADPDPALDPD